MIEERELKIIRSLVKRNTPMTIDAIAEEIGVSNRTVRNTLPQVEEKIFMGGLVLQRKPGVGISIEGTEETKLKLINDLELNDFNQYIEPYTPEDRKNMILKKLFMNEEDITTRELANELYVSQVTIQKDFNDIKTWLDNYNLKLIRDKKSVIRVSGKEENCRVAIAQLIASINGYEELKSLLYQNEKVDIKTREKIVKMIDLKYEFLEKIVFSAEKKLGFKFSDEAFTSLVIHIAISIRRLKEGKDICLSNEVITTIKNKKEYAIAEQIASDIEAHYQVTLPEQEIGYLFLHIIGTKMLQNPLEAEDLEFNFKDEEQLAVTIAKEVISVAGNALSMDFSNDSHLLNGLILHLRPTINRLEYGLSLKNPILAEVKENYPKVYGAAWMTNVIFEKYLNKKIMDEEIGYIAMHLAAAVERKQTPLRTLIVCTSGIGTAQLLAVKLGKRFNRIDIKGIKSISSLQTDSLNDIDIIISTIPVNTEKPSLNISPILTQSDIKRIEFFLNDIDKVQQNKMQSLFDEAFIFTNLLAENKYDVIDYLCLKLLKNNCVNDQYNAEVVNRERMYSTEIGKGVAIPHTIPGFVIQSKIAVAILKEPIKWDEDYVDIVFMMAISERDTESSISTLKNFYRELDSKPFLDELRSLKNEEEILQRINRSLQA